MKRTNWLAFPFTLNIHHPIRCRLTTTIGSFANRFGPQAFSPNKWQTIDSMQHQVQYQQSYRDSVRPTLEWFRCNHLSKSFYLLLQPIPVVHHNLQMNRWINGNCVVSHCVRYRLKLRKVCDFVNESQQKWRIFFLNRSDFLTANFNYNILECLPILRVWCKLFQT